MQFLPKTGSGRTVTTWKAGHIEVRVEQSADINTKAVYIQLIYGGDVIHQLASAPVLAGFVTGDLLRTINKHVKVPGKKRLKKAMESIASAYVTDCMTSFLGLQDRIITSRHWESRNKFFPKTIPILKD